MAKKWRKFEKFVARIEAALASENVVIKSPDKVPELISGRMREVDVSIREKIGTVPVLITVECRRRKKTDDVTWIEQLAKKKERIGAAKTVAVSSKELSKGAIIAAREMGIELRSMAEVDEKIIRQWLTTATFEVTRRDWRVNTVEYVFYIPGMAPSELEEVVRDAPAQYDYHAPIFEQISGGPNFSTHDIVCQLDDAGALEKFDVPLNGDPVKHMIQLKYPKPHFKIVHKGVDLPIHVLRFGLEFKAAVVDGELRRAFGQYKEGSDILYESAQLSMTIEGQEVTASIQRDAKDGSITNALTILDPKTGTMRVIPTEGLTIAKEKPPAETGGESEPTSSGD